MRLRKHFDGLDASSRRQFMGNAAHGFLGLSALPLIGQAGQPQDELLFQDDGQVPLRPATAKNVIYLYMSGGISHIDTFDPKPGSPTQGPLEAIRTQADGVRLTEYFPSLARHMNKVAVINSMFTTQGAHAQGRYFMHTSYEMRGTIKHPSLGAWLNRMGGKLNPALPGHVAIGNGQHMASAGFFESKYAPLPIGDPARGLNNSKRPSHISQEQFERRLERARSMNEAFAGKYDQRKVRAYKDMYEEAIRLMDSRDLAAFDIAKEPEYLREAYGDDRFGQGCLLARRLVEHGVRYVEVVSGGWDTHNNNFDELGEKAPALDRTLATLLADLECRGLLEETLVVVATEFGRTPEITSDRKGRNHYPKAFSCLLAGGGVKGGQCYGKTDPSGAEIIENPVSVPDFNATIAYALGLPTEHILYSPSKRPFQVSHKGKPLTELFG